MAGAVQNKKILEKKYHHDQLGKDPNQNLALVFQVFFIPYLIVKSSVDSFHER